MSDVTNKLTEEDQEQGCRQKAARRDKKTFLSGVLYQLVHQRFPDNSRLQYIRLVIYHSITSYDKSVSLQRAQADNFQPSDGGDALDQGSVSKR